MNKIQRISSLLIKVLNLLLILVPMYLVMQWFFYGRQATELSNFINYFGSIERIVNTSDAYIDINTLPWTFGLKVFGFCADLIGLLPFIISLVLIKKLFINYKEGNIFTKENAVIYRNVGIIYLIDALFVKSLSDTLLTLVVSIANPLGPKFIGISFVAANLTTLFYGILVIIVSWVMLEASKIHDENQFTI